MPRSRAQTRLEPGKSDLDPGIRSASPGYGSASMTWLQRYRVRHYCVNSIWILAEVGDLQGVASNYAQGQDGEGLPEAKPT